VSSPFAWLWKLLPASTQKKKTLPITIPKFAADPTPYSIQLSNALQYGGASLALVKFIKEFTAKVYQPAYANWDVIQCVGSTDAWSKIAPLLLENGDGYLVEEWTYPSALASALPSGFSPVPVEMDGAGLSSSGLEKLLAEWNPDEHGGMRRPRLLYTIPVCQNPTGASLPVPRKKEIYDICVKYDVIICEDDPYYFLQAGEYEPASVRASSASSQGKHKETDDEFIASLIPSYLRFDYQGRVLRIDTFSKTIAPGSRAGWVTGHPVLIERLVRASETSVQGPSGFAQILIGKLLAEEWGMTGYLRWLKGLKAQYRERRNTLVDALLAGADASLDARESATQPGTYEIRLAGPGTDVGEKFSGLSSAPLLSFVAPEGGMFIWLRVHFSQHPSFGVKSTNALLLALWEEIAEAKVLVAPGSMFSAREFPPSGDVEMMDVDDKNLVVADNGDGFFRMAFSMASAEEMQKAMGILGKVTKKFFHTQLE